MSKLDEIIDHATHEAIIGEEDIDWICTEAMNNIKTLIIDLIGTDEPGSRVTATYVKGRNRLRDELRKKVGEL